MNQINNKIMGLLGDVDINQIDTIINLVQSQLLNKLRKYDKTITQIPEELEYIIIELTIARFNYIGNEGMKAENVEGRSMTFFDNYIHNFNDDIKLWAIANNYLDDNKGKVLFLWDAIKKFIYVKMANLFTMK